jgi:hypothetical protein
MATYSALVEACMGEEARRHNAEAVLVHLRACACSLQRVARLAIAL